MGRTRTVVKSRYYQRGSGRTAAAVHQGKRGLGARRSISNALRYIETRPLGTEETAEDRHLFSRDEDALRRSEAREQLAERATGRMAYHSLVLSPGPGADSLSTAELQEWTRQVLADLEGRMGRDLTWYAAVHRHTAHPHVHVIVGASTPDNHGRPQPVRLSRDDLRALRESGDRWHEYLQREQMLWQEASAYAAEVARELSTVLVRSLGSGGGSGGIGRSDRAEIERQLWDRDHER